MCVCVCVCTLPHPEPELGSPRCFVHPVFPHWTARESIRSQWSQNDEERRGEIGWESSMFYNLIRHVSPWLHMKPYLIQGIDWKHLGLVLPHCMTVFIVPGSPPHSTPHGPSAWQEPLLVDLFFTANLLPLVSLKGLFSTLLFLVSFHVSCDRLFLTSLIWGSEVAWQGSHFIFIIFAIKSMG